MFTYCLEKDCDIWTNQLFETKEEAVVAAISEIKDIMFSGDRNMLSLEGGDVKFFIAEANNYKPSILLDYIVEDDINQAFEMCGEVAEDYLSGLALHCKPNSQERKIFDEMQNKLHNFYCQLLTDYGFYPNFFSIENIEKIDFMEVNNAAN